jgi:hypothetical protein
MSAAASTRWSTSGLLMTHITITTGTRNPKPWRIMSSRNTGTDESDNSLEVTGKHIVDSTTKRTDYTHPLNIADGFVNVPVATLSISFTIFPSHPTANPSSPHQSHSDPMHVYSHHAPYISAYLVCIYLRNSLHLLDA